ncbi:MAG: methyltransferase domain-containing protein [Candidatus Latescibacteria bacterium]|nr:methyltransferase domain-containing protein [Candidatus Latescibacterota bacterium]
MPRTATLLLCLCWAVQTRAQQAASPAQTWDQRYAAEEYLYGKEPVEFLRAQIGRLGRGRALCLAAGEGRNEVFLAQQGFAVVAVDVSARGLEKCQALAKERGVQVQTVKADLRDWDLGKAQYALITDFYYYQPDLFPKIIAALKPGGIFIMQNFSLDQPATNRFGPRDPAYLAKPAEVLAAFAGCRIRYYEDTVVQLDEGMHQGAGAVIRLIAEKPR